MRTDWNSPTEDRYLNLLAGCYLLGCLNVFLNAVKMTGRLPISATSTPFN